MSKEIELKMTVLPSAVGDSLSGLLEILGVGEVKETWLANTYFDTPDLLLNKSRIALRVREKGGTFIQTLKTAGQSMGGLSRRGEWEWDLSENKLDATLLTSDVWPSEIPVENLVPIFETNFKRVSAIIESSGTNVELAIDEGYILAGERRWPLSELELEIIEGEAGALFGIAAKIAEIMPVMLSDISKAEKGYRLLNSDLFNRFSYDFDCSGDYQLYIKSLVERNFSYWLYCVGQIGFGSEKVALQDMISALTTLKELVCNYQYVNEANDFKFAGLFDVEICRLSALLYGCTSGAYDIEMVLSKESGVLAVGLACWLRNN